MKKLITLSLISFIGIAPAFSKSFTIGISSNISKCKTHLIPKILGPVNAHVNFIIQKAGKGTLVVSDESGSTVLTQQVVLVAGKNKITIHNISSFKEGTYTFKLTTSHKTYSTAFVLWK